jgi:FlaA1/EpsC-like NDP-sugar epimerase
VREFYQVVLACSTGLMVVVILIFLRRELFDSRFIVLVAWIISIIFISISRGIIRSFQRYLYKYGIGVHKIILVGDSRTADILMKEFSAKKYSGFEVVKRIRDFKLETAQELAEFVKIKKIDEVIQSDPNLSKAEILRLFDFTDEYQLLFKYAADLLGTKVLKTELSELAGIPIVKVMKTPLDGWGRIAKRFFDFVLMMEVS